MEEEPHGSGPKPRWPRPPGKHRAAASRHSQFLVGSQVKSSRGAGQKKANPDSEWVPVIGVFWDLACVPWTDPQRSAAKAYGDMHEDCRRELDVNT